MIVHIPERDLIIKARWRNILRWPGIASMAASHWGHGYITILGLRVREW